ncbi:hypothetical protein FRB93_003598 [Tulasnella sp. JGI-2019a]|nr:hypothetical protein FRB93_003598 [Tulasnella sp. JGI-2019a]
MKPYCLAAIVGFFTMSRQVHALPLGALESTTTRPKLLRRQGPLIPFEIEAGAGIFSTLLSGLGLDSIGGIATNIGLSALTGGGDEAEGTEEDEEAGAGDATEEETAQPAALDNYLSMSSQFTPQRAGSSGGSSGYNPVVAQQQSYRSQSETNQQRYDPDQGEQDVQKSSDAPQSRPKSTVKSKLKLKKNPPSTFQLDSSDVPSNTQSSEKKSQSSVKSHGTIFLLSDDKDPPSQVKKSKITVSKLKHKPTPVTKPKAAPANEGNSDKADDDFVPVTQRTKKA